MWCTLMVQRVCMTHDLHALFSLTSSVLDPTVLEMCRSHWGSCWSPWWQLMNRCSNGEGCLSKGRHHCLRQSSKQSIEVFGCEPHWSVWSSKGGTLKPVAKKSPCIRPVQVCTGWQVAQAQANP